MYVDASSCPRPRDGFLLPVSTRTSFRRNDGGTTSCPRTRVPRGGRWGQGWIPAFAGMTVEPRRARGRGYPEGGGGARDGFLRGQASQEMTVEPGRRARERGYPEGEAHGAGDGFLLPCRTRFAGMTVEPRRARGRGYPEGGVGPGMDSSPFASFPGNDGGTTSCPRTRVPRGGRWWQGGTPPRPTGWIPAFAGMTVEPRRARGRGYPEGGGALDGFLLSQE